MFCLFPEASVTLVTENKKEKESKMNKTKRFQVIVFDRNAKNESIFEADDLHLENHTGKPEVGDHINIGLMQAQELRHADLQTARTGFARYFADKTGSGTQQNEREP
jgi:hypothetical protein